MGFVNETRGLAISGTGFTYLTEGAYGVIFVDREAGKIVKAFRRTFELDHVRAVFEAETNAYRIAALSSDLSVLIPGRFELTTLNAVTDKNGQDATDEFYPGLAFETDFVEGPFYKIGSTSSTEAARVHKLFHNVGIHHTIDMSVTVNAHGTIVKAVDFATEHHELMHED